MISNVGIENVVQAQLVLYKKSDIAIIIAGDKELEELKKTREVYKIFFLQINLIHKINSKYLFSTVVFGWYFQNYRRLRFTHNFEGDRGGKIAPTSKCFFVKQRL